MDGAPRDGLSVLGLDPGLRRTGWGIVRARDNHLRHVANGTITPPTDTDMAARLAHLHFELERVIAEHAPDVAAVEAVFVHKNAESALKLGQARGIALLVPAQRGLPVAEYAANAVKKAVVGVGHASKDQIGLMVRTLLAGAAPATADAADALAVAICHAHHAATGTRLKEAVAASAGEIAS